MVRPGKETLHLSEEQIEEARLEESKTRVVLLHQAEMQGPEKKAEEVELRQLAEQEMVQKLEVEKQLTSHHHQN